METMHPLFSKRSATMKPSFIREILKSAGQPGIISFAGGLPNAALFPTEQLQASTEKVFKNYGAKALQYSTSEGIPELKDWIKNYYWQEYQMEISEEEILITSGSQQGLDLVSRSFINPGDKVLIEEPGYLGAINCFKSNEANLIPLPIQHNGPNPEDFKNTLLFNPDIKLFYSVPTFQNPSGACYSPQTRQLIIEECKKYDLLLIEDDPYSEITFTAQKPEPLKKQLGSQGILLGSFSKTLSPGLRCGWVIAEKNIISALTKLKQSCDLHTSSLNQYLIYQFLKDYDFKEHIEKIRRQYQEHRDTMAEEIHHKLWAKCDFNLPEGGLFIWLELPPHTKVDVILQKAFSRGLLFVPGSTFMLDKGSTFIRLNYSNSSKEAIKKGIEILRASLVALY